MLVTLMTEACGLRTFGIWPISPVALPRPLPWVEVRVPATAFGELCASFTMEGKAPRSVIVVTAERVYTQCPKALVRSRLWDASRHVDEAASLPSSGAIMKTLQEGFDGDAYDRNYPQRLKETIY